MSIWPSIGEWIQKLEAEVVPLIKECIVPAIDVLNVIKEAVNSTVAIDIATALDGAVGAADLAWISNALSTIITDLGLLENGIVATPNNSIQLTVNYLKTLPHDDIRDAHYVKIVSLLAKSHTTATKFLPTQIDDYSQQTYTKSALKTS